MENGVYILANVTYTGKTVTKRVILIVCKSRCQGNRPITPKNRLVWLVLTPTRITSSQSICTLSLFFQASKTQIPHFCKRILSTPYSTRPTLIILALNSSDKLQNTVVFKCFGRAVSPFQAYKWGQPQRWFPQIPTHFASDLACNHVILLPDNATMKLDMHAIKINLKSIENFKQGLIFRGESPLTFPCLGSVGFPTWHPHINLRFCGENRLIPWKSWSRNMPWMLRLWITLHLTL